MNGWDIAGWVIVGLSVLVLLAAIFAVIWNSPRVEAWRLRRAMNEFEKVSAEWDAAIARFERAFPPTPPHSRSNPESESGDPT